MFNVMVSLKMDIFKSDNSYRGNLIVVSEKNTNFFISINFIYYLL